MLVTVTLNTAIDKRLHVMGFAPGQVHRTTAEHTTAGGKGLNVARVIAQLGEAVAVTGFLGGANGTLIRLDDIARLLPEIEVSAGMKSM